MGIELVAPHAQPCGLQLVRSRDDHSQYLRGLLLPEISAIDLPATLLAPRLPFQEGSKVLINTQGEEHRAGSTGGEHAQLQSVCLSLAGGCEKWRE
jgi:hypothetical protein